MTEHNQSTPPHERQPDSVECEHDDNTHSTIPLLSENSFIFVFSRRISKIANYIVDQQLKQLKSGWQISDPD